MEGSVPILAFVDISTCMDVDRNDLSKALEEDNVRKGT